MISLHPSFNTGGCPLVLRFGTRGAGRSLTVGSKMEVNRILECADMMEMRIELC